jgi:hypothetical protein
VPALFNRDNVGTGLANLGDLTGWTNVGWTSGTFAFPPRPDVRSLRHLGPREDRLTTPSFVPATDAVSIYMTHYHSYEHTLSPLVYNDGMVVELSTDDGATWSDIGASADGDGYQGTIAPRSIRWPAARPSWARSANSPCLDVRAGRLLRRQDVPLPAAERLRRNATGGRRSYIRILEIDLAPGASSRSRSSAPSRTSATWSPSSPPRAARSVVRAARREPDPAFRELRFDLPRTALVTVDVFDVRVAASKGF